MSELFRERVTRFLNEYLDIPEWQTDCDGVAFNNTIKSGLRMLVESIMTPREITEELFLYDVILPPSQIITWISEPQGG